jgi:hypothetical protein
MILSYYILSIPSLFLAMAFATVISNAKHVEKSLMNMLVCISCTFDRKAAFVNIGYQCHIMITIKGFGCKLYVAMPLLP